MDAMEQKGIGCTYGSQIGIHKYTLFGDKVQLIQSVLKNPGIRLEDQDKIFERFYRIRNEENPSRGSGLGLSIAREIVKAHGGRIWVESEPGKGSTFFIELPKEKTEHR